MQYSSPSHCVCRSHGSVTASPLRAAAGAALGCMADVSVETGALIAGGGFAPPAVPAALPLGAVMGVFAAGAVGVTVRGESDFASFRAAAVGSAPDSLPQPNAATKHKLAGRNTVRIRMDHLVVRPFVPT